MKKTAAWPLAAIYAVLIIYASLYPFQNWRSQGVDWTAFVWAPWPRYWTGFDILSNVLGYAPLGFIVALALQRSARHLPAVGLTLALGSLLALVMGAWGRELHAAGKVRMLGDGDAEFTKATGLTLDLTGKGLGLRSNRYSMLVKDGKVVTLNIEGPGKFEVSDADTLLSQTRH